MRLLISLEKGIKGDIMRRKCFYLFIFVLMVLYTVDFIGIPLKKGIDEELFKGSRSFTGRVISVQQKDDCLRLAVEIESAEGDSVSLGENVLLSIYGTEDKPWEFLNRRISFETALEHPKGQRNPHCFDYARYLKSRGTGAVAETKKIKLEPCSLTMNERYEIKLCEKKYLFCRNLSEESRGIVMGILFGDTTFLDEDAYDEFRKNGTAHILAVSGLHVGIIYGIYEKLAGRRKNIPALFLLAFVLYTYGELSCWSPSVSRAVLMIAMSVMAKLADLRYDMLTAMSAAAFMLIIRNPYVIFGTGFQMSFLAICSIAFLRPVMPAKIPENAAVMFSVYLGLLPYQIYQFNYISLTSLIANIPVIYLAGYFVPVSAAGFLLFAFFGDAGAAGGVIDAMGRLIYFINGLTSLNGRSGFDVASPPLWAVLLISAFMFFLSSELFAIMKLRRQRSLIYRCMGGVLAISFLFQIFAYSPLSDDRIVFVDVGQGDSVHINSNGMDVLIDGGGSIGYNVGKKTLKPYLLKNGATDIDLALATHQHMDHMKGLEELQKVYPVKKLMTGLTAGTEINVNKDVKIQTLWPESIPENEGQDANSLCSVFMIFYKEYKILVTGDLDEKGEKMMLGKYFNTDVLAADVLKIVHHGSPTSTCDEFLEAVNPTYAVIQTGKNNYGHPSPKIIEKCAEKGIIVYRNDYNGAIGFSFGKRGITCHTVTETGE